MRQVKRSPELLQGILRGTQMSLRDIITIATIVVSRHYSEPQMKALWFQLWLYPLGTRVDHNFKASHIVAAEIF